MGKIIPVDFGEGIDTEWWLTVLSWVDLDDVLYAGQGAFVFFMDMLVKRPTEFTVFLTLFLEAYERGAGRTEATDTQRRALDFAAEAKRLNKPVAHHVAKSMSISVRGAFSLLKRAKKAEAKMYTFEPKSLYINRDTFYLPTEKEIRRKVAGMTTPCPGFGWNDDCLHTAKLGRDLCWSCYRKAFESGVYGECPDDLRWLRMLIDDNRRQMRDQAIEMLMDTAQYGSVDELDEMISRAA